MIAQLIVLVLAGALVGALSEIRGFWPCAAVLFFGFSMLAVTWQVRHGWPGFMTPQFMSVFSQWFLAMVSGLVLGGVLLNPAVRKVLKP